MRIALGLEYDGAPYCGWQHQPGGCAVQDHLEAALSSVAAGAVGTIAAGRTDAGVHARAQVVHFDTGADREDVSWVRGTNACLPGSIRVVWARRVPESFHARHGARSRTYQYLLMDDSVAPAILRTKAGWFHRRLDVAAMNGAAATLVGERDFSAFRDAQCQARSPVRIVHEAKVERIGSLVVVTIRANAFLHHMVRNVVGSLVYIGAGRKPAAWIPQLLDGRDRRLAAPTFPPDGLYLCAIEYDSAFGLPAFRPNPLLPSP
ncbi:MAG TPA: tRNA pseudouridine(38-40) synthase TruA [Usitatibacteraceae bacterium]|nr:tRNA pseudouridine(38-40) synthase TruA [Usitatibacteraceae bacterium]